MLFFLIYLLLGSLFLDADTDISELPDAIVQAIELPDPRPAPAVALRRPAPRPVKTDEELTMEILGLVNVQALEPSIRVQLAYASNRNLLGVALYNGFNKAYLQPGAALKLAAAQRMVRGTQRNLSLLVHDAARPHHVQLRCRELAAQRNLRHLFGSSRSMSMHSYGVAVDVSLIDTRTGRELDMGCPVDAPGALASPLHEGDMLADGRLSPAQFANRILLRNAMTRAGFTAISNEWWHFEACPRRVAEALYRPVP